MGWIERLRNTVRPSAAADAFDEETRFHLEARIREYVADGMSPGEARRLAERRLGNLTLARDRTQDADSVRWLADLGRDVRYAVRTLRRAPGFTATAVLTLALGIGANTAIFSVVDQLLVRPLPYPNDDGLVVIHEIATGDRANGRAGTMSVSPANWFDWQGQSQALQSVAAWNSQSLTLTGVGEPVRLVGQTVSAEFFPLLGVAPQLGRVFLPEDDQPDMPRVAVLSSRLWQQRFGGDPGVIGQMVHVNDVPVEVVGVMPSTFHFVDPAIEIWTPMQLDRAVGWRESAGRFINVVARVRPGTSLETTRAELVGIAARLAQTYEFNQNTSVEVVSLRYELTGPVQSVLLFLYAAVGVLLAIACFNVASLLLARGAARQHDIGVRTSLGAGRFAIVRQLLVESLLLALAGCAIGMVLARWSLGALLTVAPADLLVVPDLRLDARVLAYSLALSILSGALIGVAPALAATRRSMAAVVRAARTRAPMARFRRVLVVCQVAMTVVLLCGAGLLLRTVLALNATDSGLNQANLLTMDLALPNARYDAERRVAFFRDAVGRLEALPGVESAAAGNSLPIVGGRAGTAFHRLGTPEVPIFERPSATIRWVGPGYFRTLGIPVLEGREFAVADDANPTPGFVVNDAFAQLYLQDVDPLSASLTVWMQAENPYLPVIGVVGDVNEGSVREGARPTIFYSHRQMGTSAMTLLLRAPDAATLAPMAVAVIHDLDPNLAVTNIETFEDAIIDSLARERLSAMVSGSLALSGLLLAALGLYGLLAFHVTERTREIGIRMALGARVASVAQDIVGGGLRLVALGIAAGIAGALLMSRMLASLLFGVTAYDVTTYVVVIVLLVAVAAVASLLPALRAARGEPLVALRQE
jgi:predicted permease